MRAERDTPTFDRDFPPPSHLPKRRQVLPVDTGVFRGGELCLDRPSETSVLQQLSESLCLGQTYWALHRAFNVSEQKSHKPITVDGLGPSSPEFQYRNERSYLYIDNMSSADGKKYSHGAPKQRSMREVSPNVALPTKRCRCAFAFAGRS